MKHHLFRRLAASTTALLLVSLGGMAAAEPRHGIAMYGEPALPPDFVSLPYANPEAPKGGTIVFGEAGGFDSLNPFIVKGQSPAQLTSFTVETLMGRSMNEPFSLYGLLAESIDTDEGRTYVEFTLREAARFADGSPVTVEDVLWSYETLGTLGNPRYHAAWKKIAKAEATGPRSVRFTFNVEDRELPLILGLRPILKKAQWEGKDFTESTLEAPIGSGPYVVATFEPGSTITYKKNPDWWGKDLAFNKGLHNADEIRVDYFSGASVVFEAFRAGELSTWIETNPAKWQTNFDFPAVAEGKVIKQELPHSRPSGIEGFAMNTRNPLFADWRVREAMIQAFNFELVNATLNAGALPRISSFYSNSILSGQMDQPAAGRVAELLAPFTADLLPGTLEGYSLPVSDGSEANRAGLRAATDLLAEAGWTVQDGVLKNDKGEPFAFDILLQTGADDTIAAASIYVEALKGLGIDAKVTTVDSAVYKERTNTYDFAMTHYIRSLSLSPGNEQSLYWGAKQAAEPGTRNWAGITSPAVDAMIEAMLKTTDPVEYTAAVQALDRALTAGRYIVPVWYNDKTRIAFDARLQHPEANALYGVYPGTFPESWWVQP
jgi:peptide/nickel transport system substrate-binding protein